MATLNTLRTKYGILLSVVIALVLLAFILGDQLNYRQNTPQTIKDSTVMVVDGKAVKESEYARIREDVTYAERLYTETFNRLREMAGDDYVNFFQMQMQLPGTIGEDGIAVVAANLAEYEKALEPAYAKLGIDATDADVNSLKQIYTKNVANALYQTGLTNRDYLVSFTDGITAWSLVQAEPYLALSQFLGLLEDGRYLNNLEVEELLRQENTSYNGHYLEVPYDVIDIKDIEVTDEEVAARRAENENYGQRTIKYVRIAREPSMADNAATQKLVDEYVAAANSAKGDVDAVRSAARKLGGTVTSGYVAVSELNDEQKSAHKAGEAFVSPAQNGSWKIDYFYGDIVDAPATLQLKATAFESKSEADAVIAKLEENGGDVEALEDTRFMTIPVDVTNAAPEFVGRFFDSKVGDIVYFEEDGFHNVALVAEVGQKGKYVDHISVEKRVDISDATDREISRKVGDFMASLDTTTFDKAVNYAGYAGITSTARVNRNDLQRLVNRTPGTRPLAIWAYDAKLNEIEQMNINGDTYIAIVTAIDTNKKDVSRDMFIRQDIIKEKRAEKVLAMLTSMDAAIEGAKKGNFKDVKFSSTDLDAHLVGAIATATPGVETKVKGDKSAYLLVVDNVNGAEIDPATFDTERVPLTETKAYNTNEISMALESKYTVTDKRGSRQL